MDALFPLQLEGFRQILSPQVPARYLMRQISIAWYRIMEEIYDDVPVGTRILVRRDRVFSPLVNGYLIHDYITTRQALPTFLNAPWSHQDVAYCEEEVSPYPFDMDAFHDRDNIMNNYRNNQNVNPLGEGHEFPDPMDLSFPALPALPALPASFPPLPDIPPLQLHPLVVDFPMVPPFQPFPLSSLSLLSAYNP